MPSHGSNTDVFGNGYVLSEFLNSATFSGNRDTGETTTFKKKSKTYIPGLKDTTMSCEGIYEGRIDQLDQVMFAALGNDVGGLFTYMPEGHEVVGSPAFSLEANQSSYEVTTDIGDVAQVSAEMGAGANGAFGRGKVARSMGVAAAAGQGAALDFNPAGVFINSLVVHATASSSLVVKIQHSTAVAGTYVDLPGSISFVNGRGSKRLTTPAMTTNRYLRVLWTGTGTFSASIEQTQG